MIVNNILLLLLSILILIEVITAAILYLILKKYKKTSIESQNLKTLCDLIQAPIWFKDENLKFTWVNEFYALMFNKPRESLSGLSDTDIAPKNLVEGYIRDDKYVIASKKVYKYKENEKAGLWFESTKFPLLSPTGKLYGLGGIAFNITAVKRSEIMLNHLVHNDYLTGVANRLFLSVEVTKRLSKVDIQSKKLALILLDIDNFKDLNEMHGHVIGDEVLKEMAERLKKIILGRDIMLGRFGGDEFVIILPEITQKEDIDTFINELREKIQPTNFQIFGDNIDIKISLGISIYPDNSSDYEGLVRYADMAMFHAKKMGRNQIVYYTDDIGRADLRRVSIESRLQGALERKEFYLVYQPKVTADGTQITGVEALLRWNNQYLGQVSPAEFIPIAERSDLVINIDEWVLETALRQNIQWKNKFGFMPIMAVNLSWRQVKGHNLLKKVENALEALNYPSSKLELELTERLLMTANYSSGEMFSALRESGVKISLDDFGTGYSNLSYLSLFPLDCLKIDRSFITDICTSADDQKIVKAIIDLAKSFNLSLIAEGVETKEQLDYVRNQGINDIQGFYFSKPLLPDELIAFNNKLQSNLQKNKN